MSDPNRRRDEHNRYHYEDSRKWGRAGNQQNQGRSGRGSVGGEGRDGMDVRDMASGNMHSGRGSQERGGHGSYRPDSGNRQGGSRSSNPPRDQNQRQRRNFPGAGSSNQVDTREEESRHFLEYNKKSDPGSIKVVTNFYPMIFKKDISGLQLFPYAVSLFGSKKRYEKDNNGNILLHESGPEIGKNRTRIEYIMNRDLFSGKRSGECEEDVSYDLTRRILLKCQHMFFIENKYMFTDGSSKVHSLDLLFGGTDVSEAPDANESPPAKKPKKDDYYGTTKKNNEEEDVYDPSPYKDVRIKTDGNRPKWFRIKFKLLAPVGLKAIFKENRLVGTAHDQEQVLYAINMGIKNSMMMKMQTFDRKSSHFFPGITSQKKLMMRLMGDHQLFPKGADSHVQATPVIGIRSRAHLLGKENLFLLASCRMDWACMPCKVVSEGQRGNITLFGMDVGKGDTPVDNVTLERMENEFDSIIFLIEYDITQSDENVIRTTKVKRRGRFSKSKIKDDPSIKPTADDVSFTVNKTGVPVKYTVESYNRSKGIILKYPKLPIVRLVGIGWFPVEFLRQEFGPKRMSNKDLVRDAALKFNDKLNGIKRINLTTDLVHHPELVCGQLNQSELSKSRDNQTDFFNRLHLQVEDQPYTVTASLLKFPNIKFHESDKRKMVALADGTWSAKDMKWISPAHLTSFAIVSCCQDNKATYLIMNKLFTMCKKHGITIPYFVDEDVTNLVTFQLPMAHSGVEPDQPVLRQRIDDAIKKSKNVFAFNTKLSENKMFFESYAKLSDGNVQKCLVDCWFSGNQDSPAVFLNDQQPTHRITYEGEEHLARLKYGIYDPDQRLVEMFDVKYNGIITILSPRGKHLKKSNLSSKPDDGAPIWSHCEDPDMKKKSALKLNEIECPSILFFITPKKNTRSYSIIKEMCLLEFGIQSSVMVLESFNKQRERKDVYFSNIAVKLNAKLANFANKGSAWKIDGHPWIAEAHTLVVGYSMASAMGQQNKMVVAISGILDSQGLTVSEDFGIQEKNPLVESELLQCQIKVLALDYFHFNKEWPQRLVVYRLGGTDSLFKKIIENELSAIKKGLADANPGSTMPLITFVVAQSQHEIKIVNSQSGYVPSGTCVEIALLGMSALQIGDDSNVAVLKPGPEQGEPFKDVKWKDGNFDFQLIPQKGLKGTSKAVLYRCIWNENFMWRKMVSDNVTQLTKDVLINVTFGLSFQYGTATKATRQTSVIKYSERICVMQTK